MLVPSDLAAIEAEVYCDNFNKTFTVNANQTSEKPGGGGRHADTVGELIADAPVMVIHYDIYTNLSRVGYLKKQPIASLEQKIEKSVQKIYGVGVDQFVYQGTYFDEKTRLYNAYEYAMNGIS